MSVVRSDRPRQDEAGLEGSSGERQVDGQTVPDGGDIITELDGEPIEGMEDVISEVNTRSPGDEITFTVLRDGDERQITVTLGDRPEEVAGVTGPQ